MFDVFVWSESGMIRVSEDQWQLLLNYLNQGCFLQLGDFCRISSWGNMFCVITQNEAQYVATANEALERLLGRSIEDEFLAAA